MYKILILLVLPLLLFSRFQITTHMPFEAFLIKKVAENYARARVITTSYSNKTLDLKYSEISKYANTTAFFHFGLDVEKEYIKMLKEVNPKIKVFDMSEGISKLTYNNKVNNYVWTDPISLRDVAKNIYNTMVLLDRANKEHYKRNYEIFLAELDESFLKIRDRLYNSDIYNIYVFDEFWSYYANRFGINVYRRPKAIVKADEINDLVSYVNRNEIKAILVSNDATYNYARSIAGNVDLPIKTNDVFNEFVLSNLWELSKELSPQLPE